MCSRLLNKYVYLPISITECVKVWLPHTWLEMVEAWSVFCFLGLVVCRCGGRGLVHCRLLYLSVHPSWGCCVPCGFGYLGGFCAAVVMLCRLAAGEGYHGSLVLGVFWCLPPLGTHAGSWTRSPLFLGLVLNRLSYWAASTLCVLVDSVCKIKKNTLQFWVWLDVRLLFSS